MRSIPRRILVSVGKSRATQSCFAQLNIGGQRDGSVRPALYINLILLTYERTDSVSEIRCRPASA